MAKIVKRFKPRYIKRLRDRPSGIAQTGAHGTSHRQNPPDIHRLGWAPRPFPRTGMTGEPNSSIMGRMGSGTLSVYTDTDREEFEDQSGMPGKGGNYKRGLKRHYVKKGGGKAMLGLPEGVIQEEEDLKKIIASIVAEMKGDADGAKAFSDEIMRSQEGDDDIDEEEDVDEQSLAGAVAGYTLPLGMSNRGPNQSPSWLAFAKSIGGTPVKVTGSRTLKVQRMNKTDKY
jgi:hypothetical protein